MVKELRVMHYVCIKVLAVYKDVFVCIIEHKLKGVEHP